MKLLLFSLFFLATCCTQLALAAVLGVDLGTEYIKVASVKPGTPFHIVVDEQTKRKFPTVVAFDSGERYFANNGLAFAAKRPKETYQWHTLLLGQTLDSPAVSIFKNEGFAYELISNSSRGGAIYVKHNEPNAEEQILSSEELVAMNLQHVLKLSELDAETGQGSVKDVVMTVPNFYTQKQRRALLDAADLAGMNVLSLLHENTAAAIQYGIDRKYDSSSLNKSHTVLFYNMGSTYTQVDLAVYTGYNSKSSKKDKDNKVVGQVEMKALSYDDTLGGHTFEWAISEWIIEHVNKELSKKAGESVNVRTLPRAMAKIRTAAEKAKVVLSANIETPVFISSVHNDVDIKMHITREQFLKLTAPLLERSVKPIHTILDEQGLKAEDIDAVLIIGGSVRIPAIQSAIKIAMNREYLNQSLNGDEAMVFGALFRAANLSTTFKVRPFGVTDIIPYPVGVRIADLTPTNTDQPVEGEEPFSKRASLFKRYNHVDKRKLVSFSHTRDFSASLFHDDPKYLPKGQTAPIGVYNITGLDELMKNEKHAELLKTQKPRVSLSFELDFSGLVTLPKAEATLEESVEVCTPKKKNSTNTVNVNTDSSSKDGTADAEKKEGDDDATEKKEGEDSKTAEENEKKEEVQSETDKVKAETDAAAAPEDGKLEEIEQECTTKKKTHTFKLKVKFQGAPGSLAPLTKSDRTFMRARLANFTRRDDAKREIAAAQNQVESYIYGSRSLMSEDDIIAVSIEEQREASLKALEEAEEWLYEKRSDDTTEVYKTKLNELKKLVEPITFRRDEVIKRQEAIDTSNNIFTHVTDSLKEFEEKRPWVKEEDRERLRTLLTDAQTWLSTKQKEQESIPSHETPAFSSRELLDKLRAIAKLTQDLEKLKKPVEKPKPKSKVNATATENATDSTTAAPDSTSETEGANDDQSTTENNENADASSSSSSQPETDATESKKDEL